MKYFAFAAVALGSALAASAAFADECASDADCPVGFACEEMYWGVCPGMPECPEGEECPEMPPCEEGSEWVCNPAPVACTSDADCTDGFECMSFSYETCTGVTDPDVPSEDGGSGSSGDSGSPDDPSVPDDAPTPDGDFDSDGDGEPDGWDCEVVTEAYCAPPYVGGCEVAEDCGPGFDCIEMEECACSGGGWDGGDGEVPPAPDDPTDPTPDDSGAGDPDSGDPSELPPPDCECYGAGEFYCQPQEIACAADSDCPADWTCQDLGRPDATETCWVDESGEVICETDADGDGEPDSEGGESYTVCTPPAWDAWGGAGGEEGMPSMPTGERDDSAEGGLGAEGAFDDDSSTEGDPVHVSAPPVIDEAGCTSAGTHGGGAASLLLALGALVIRRRR